MESNCFSLANQKYDNDQRSAASIPLLLFKTDVDTKGKMKRGEVGIKMDG